MGVDLLEPFATTTEGHSLSSQLFTDSLKMRCGLFGRRQVNKTVQVRGWSRRKAL
jgi:hypothetical protein